MRRRVFLLSIALSGCGLVSGLDAVHVGDASDASDAASDGDGPEATAADAASTSDAPSDGAGVHCGAMTCTGSTVCCVGPNSGANQFTCSKDICGGSSIITLHCDDKSDCTNSASQVCCFTGTSASCGLATGSCTPLCNGDGQCDNGNKCVPFDAGAGLALSKCQ